VPSCSSISGGIVISPSANLIGEIGSRYLTNFYVQ
jgi:hypothetical protein